MNDSTFPKWFGFDSGSGEDGDVGGSDWIPWPDAAAAKYGVNAALKLGLVFDSPVKTQREIDFSLR